MVVEGVGLNQYNQWSTSESNVTTFQHRLHFLSPLSYGSTMAEELSILPLSQNRLDDLREQYGSIDKALDQSGCFKVFKSAFNINVDKPLQSSSSEAPLKLRLLLTMDQMIQQGYPVPVRGGLMEQRYQGYVHTCEEYAPVSADSPLISIDCEMVRTTRFDHELARICVMDQDYKVLYSSFVHPDNPITSYLTKFSGITPQMLSGIKTKLTDVQRELKKVIPPNAILVGHSLDSDLRAIQMFHPYIIDTSVIFCLSDTRAKKSKLKQLAKVFLDEDIQPEDVEGHDPEEDARAAMDLVKLKLQKGYEFGDTLLDPSMHLDLKSREGGTIATSTLSTVRIHDKTVSVIGAEDELKRYAGFSEDSDCFKVVDKNKCAVDMCTESKSHLTICHLSLANVKEAKASKSVWKLTGKLWASIPENGLFVTIWPGTGIDNPAFVGISINKAKI